MMEYRDDGLELLRIEIVGSAVRDLKTAMAESDRKGRKTSRQIALERWFLSTWGQLLSGGNGEEIIDRCRRTYKVGRHKNGVQRVPEQTKRAILEDWERGMLQKDIAKKYNVSLNWTHKFIRGKL